MFLFLIPKKCGANSLENFRPISLCDSIYQIISKFLTLKFLVILPNLISDQRKGFIPRRQVLNSIIYVHENIHSLSPSNSHGFLMKVDIAKAYERFDQSFFQKVFIFFGFSEQILWLVIQLVSTSSLDVLVNGSSFYFLILFRGIRQGDLISPILFRIMIDSLDKYIGRFVLRGVIQGVRPSSHLLLYSHEQFVDDTIFLEKYDVREVRGLKKALNLYSTTTRKLINWDKSSLFFINTPIIR